jgi:hypothetical protein
MAGDSSGLGTGEVGHRWRFYRVGGFDQVRLDQGEDLRALDQLDRKLWLALSCPTRGLEIDTRTLDLIDTDHDGRIRVPEILAAIRWTCSVLKDPGDLANGSAALPLSAVNDLSPEGKALLDSARQILANLGKPDAAEITVEDTSDTSRIFAQTRFNGDGVVPADSADDEATKAVIAQIIDCLGAETDRSGKPGVSQAEADRFFAEAEAYVNWWKVAESDAEILPLGEATPGAAAAYAAVRTKVDDYFTRCRLAAFDPGAAGALNPQGLGYAALAAKDLSSFTPEVAAFPLARVEPDRPLPLSQGLNPAWTLTVSQLRARVVTPLLGPKNSLTAADWERLSAQFASYETWVASKAGAAVERLGLQRVREILAGPSRGTITALIARDKALEPQALAIADVDRAVHYYRDLQTVLHNFVSFRDFYSRKAKAVFQAGTLYLDGRACDLCVRVEDVARHGAFAGLSRCYLAYCDCTRRGGGDKMAIVAAFTGGDSDFLIAGRNGLFYDRRGQDWDATIVRVVENPISVRQAFWTPYKRVARFVEEQIEKFAGSREKAVGDRMTAGVAQAAQATAEGRGPAAQAFDIAKFAGIFAAIGLALGAVGSALAAAAKGFMGLSVEQMPLAVAGALLVISGPSMLLAYMKLRQRNLGPILEANGWAINGRVRINIPFGHSLTTVAALPKGAEVSLRDPYAEKPNPWPKVIVVLVILLLALYYLNDRGKLREWTGIGKRVQTQQTAAPAGASQSAEAAGAGAAPSR